MKKPYLIAILNIFRLNTYTISVTPLISYSIPVTILRPTVILRKNNYFVKTNVDVITVYVSRLHYFDVPTRLCLGNLSITSSKLPLNCSLYSFYIADSWWRLAIHMLGYSCFETDAAWKISFDVLPNQRHISCNHEFLRLAACLLPAIVDLQYD